MHNTTHSHRAVIEAIRGHYDFQYDHITVFEIFSAYRDLSRGTNRDEGLLEDMRTKMKLQFGVTDITPLNIYDLIEISLGYLEGYGMKRLAQSIHYQNLNWNFMHIPLRDVNINNLNQEARDILTHKFDATIINKYTIEDLLKISIEHLQGYGIEKLIASKHLDWRCMTKIVDSAIEHCKNLDWRCVAKIVGSAICRDVNGDVIAKLYDSLKSIVEIKTAKLDAIVTFFGASAVLAKQEIMDMQKAVNTQQSLIETKYHNIVTYDFHDNYHDGNVAGNHGNLAGANDHDPIGHHNV